jgi:hypothetical protein
MFYLLKHLLFKKKKEIIQLLLYQNIKFINLKIEILLSKNIYLYYRFDLQKRY